MIDSSMVIYDLNFLCARFGPLKAYTPLIVDTDAILANTVTFEALKAITGRHPQITQPACNLELPQLSTCDSLDVQEPPHAYPFRERFGIGTLERYDHEA
jgi:hypothetical protein